MKLQNVINDFLLFCDKRNHSESTKKTYVDRIKRFTRYLLCQNVDCYSKISKHNISKYFTGYSEHARTTVKEECHVIRVFMKFLHQAEITFTDLSDEVPKYRFPVSPYESRLWSEDEIQRLLAVIDRGSPRGKRDYAIILMAARLGMRDSDIRGLRLDNLNWENQSIDYVQSKTSIRNVLPISEEIGLAIINYLKFGRPETDCVNLFVSCVPLYGEVRQAGHYIEMYRKKAGISKEKGKHAGIHSLRHNLATNLLAAHVNVDHIFPILGHVNPETIHRYFQTDVENLRKCALSFEVV